MQISTKISISGKCFNTFQIFKFSENVSPNMKIPWNSQLYLPNAKQSNTKQEYFFSNKENSTEILCNISPPVSQ